MSIESFEKRRISLEDFAQEVPSELKLETLAARGSLAERFLDSSRIQKLGLALTGFSHYIHRGRIQILGQSEISYLDQLSDEDRLKALENLDFEQITCILVTKDISVPPELLIMAEENSIPVFKTVVSSSRTISAISEFLETKLAPAVTLHGVMLGMYELGILFLGESGVGKSECALDLIMRGHRLIADDAVLLRRIGEALMADSPELTREHLEIRGLGIINVREVFGASSIGTGREVNLCIELKAWDSVGEITRLGLETDQHSILGLDIPKFVIPVSHGRNLSSLVETAVRVYLNRTLGNDSAADLIEKYDSAVSGRG